MSSENLNKYIGKYKVFIDTCSLLEDGSIDFLKNNYELLREKDENIIVPKLVIKELLNFSKGNDKELKKKSETVLNILIKFKNCNLIQIRGEEGDDFADNVFLTVFTRYRLKYNLLLITQDKNLAKEIEELNNSKAVKSDNIIVRKLDNNGNLVKINQKDKDKNKKKKVKARPKKNVLKEEEKFKLLKKVNKIDNNNIKVKFIPDEDNFVYTKDNKKIKLVKKLATGGEGSVFTTDTDYVAKIYKREKITRSKLEKINLMSSKKIVCPGVCWPIDVLYNEYNEFIGYLMPKAKGKEMQKLFLSKMVLLKNMPNWKKRDTVQLCITILEKIKYLHDRNIILGDINLLNILIVSPIEVYFVDTDSYQIEGFPCPVGTTNFTAQEILLEDEKYKKEHNGERRRYSDYLRTFENEYFAVAVLLFMIMLPGKPPYSLQGGQDIKQNILNMNFSYPLGKKSNRKTPNGPWRFIWSHLPYNIKKDFYNTFMKNGDFSVRETRLSVEEWLEEMKNYLRLLDSGIFAKQDKMSEELFPNRFKIVEGVEYQICKSCGKKFPKRNFKNGICYECRSIKKLI